MRNASRRISVRVFRTAETGPSGSRPTSSLPGFVRVELPEAGHHESGGWMTTFNDLGVRAELVAALAEQGITEAFPVQEVTIRDAIAGRDVCGKAKTGSGKTLAFGLPVLQSTQKNAAPGKPRSLILVPTRELARQVLEVLRPLADTIGLRAAAFYGGSDMDRQQKALRRGVDIAVCTPGRLIDLMERKVFVGSAVETVVLDEADRMADMGFLPQVEWVLRKLDNRKQTMLFSATLDGDVDVVVRRYLKDPVKHEVESSEETVEEMHHRFLAVHQLDRVKVIGSIAAGAFRTLVFVRTKRGADRLVEQLAREGVRALALHGDLRQPARERAVRDFSAGKVPVLVATDVAARGIHIDDIDVVVHFDLPEDHKAYLHRSGRTARAGKPGVVAPLGLWDQVLDAERIQKRLGIRQPLVEMFSNDPRLADLAAWDPTAA